MLCYLESGSTDRKAADAIRRPLTRFALLPALVAGASRTRVKFMFPAWETALGSDGAVPQHARIHQPPDGRNVIS
jgi:hypothetical protein